MKDESGIRQRAIVGQRLAFSDSELVTKYTLPFVDRTWRVPFIVLDLLGHPPQILDGPIHRDGLRLRTSEPQAALRPIESVPIDDVASLVHYDPWWAFRGVSGVDRAWINAIIATNIAHPFVHESKRLKIHDLRFTDGMDRLEGLIAKDDAFRIVELHPGDLDLLGLRHKARAATTDQTMTTRAKAL